MAKTAVNRGQMNLNCEFDLVIFLLQSIEWLIVNHTL
jgi:hypothetical protein